MNQVALFLNHTTIYGYSVVLALAAAAGVCFFLACCQGADIPPAVAARTAAAAVAASLVLARLVYWHCRPDSFASLREALTTPASGSLALAGAFFGCALAALTGGLTRVPKLLDCMSVAGCGAIALGRLGSFFSSSDRGQILTDMTGLPWAYPVVNAASGQPEYRLAVFLFQAVVAGGLFLVLAVLFFSRRTRRPGQITVLFLMVYCASQVLLDSTRYDSLYLRANGFVSMVQVLAAVALVGCLVIVALGAVKARGPQKWMIPAWVAQTALFALAGYMEYFVQRHGRLAFFAYSVMEHCLVGIVVLGILLWRLSASTPKQVGDPA